MTDDEGWEIVPEVPLLAPGEVHVWRVSVQALESFGTRFLTLLDAQERRRASRFHFEADRHRFVVSHGVTRWLLGHYTGIPAASLVFENGPAGKPLLHAGSSTRVQFNLSHSGDVVLLAVSLDAAVGVDVERWSAGIAYVDLIEQFFSAAERAEFVALAVPEHQAAFFACWSRKEAYIKATGLGVSEGLDYFDVPVAPRRPPELIADRRHPEQEGHWRMADLAMRHGYSAAVVVAAGSTRVRTIELGPELLKQRP